MAFYDDIPEKLNGYPVVACARYGMRDLVIVQRPHAYHPFVAATWDGNSAWHWGHYCANFDEAKAIFPDVALWRLHGIYARLHPEDFDAEMVRVSAPSEEEA